MRLERGELHFNHDESRLALTDIERALELDPQLKRAHNCHALLMLAQKRDLDAAASLSNLFSSDIGMPPENLAGSFFWRFPFSHSPTVEP